MTNGAAYDDTFRIRVVDRFLAYFETLTGLTAAARAAAEDFGVAPSTVLSWAESQHRTPKPTWGEIRRLRAQNAHLRARVEVLETCGAFSVSDDEAGVE